MAEVRCFLAQTDEDRSKPGAIWWGHEGSQRIWVVMLPCGYEFRQDQKTSDGGRRWTCTGELPNVTVTPSINYIDLWNGTLTNGVLRKF